MEAHPLNDHIPPKVPLELEQLECVDDDVDGQLSLCRKRSRSFGAEAFSTDEAREIRQRLDVGLSRSETMQRPGPGGCRLTYIEGWKVIHDANQIFGFNGWSSHLVALDLRFIEETNRRFNACVCATVRITLRDGAFREDRGGGVAENMRSKGDAILKAEKEAVTDATKRALKNFGLRLGLSLYDRQHVRDMNRPQPPAATGEQNGTRTPVAKRPTLGSSSAAPRTGLGASPVTPAAVVGAHGGGGGATSAEGAASGGGQFAAQREAALQRKQAFLKGKAEQGGCIRVADGERLETRVQRGGSATELTRGASMAPSGGITGVKGLSIANGPAVGASSTGAEAAMPVNGFRQYDYARHPPGSEPKHRISANPESRNAAGRNTSGRTQGVNGCVNGGVPNPSFAGSADLGPSATERQREIDELRAMALANF